MNSGAGVIVGIQPDLIGRIGVQVHANVSRLPPSHRMRRLLETWY
jgi:hypothetical protein